MIGDFVEFEHKEGENDFTKISYYNVNFWEVIFSFSWSSIWSLYLQAGGYFFKYHFHIKIVLVNK